MINRIPFLSALALIVCVIAACGAAPEPVNQTPEPPSVTPVSFIFVEPEELAPPTVTPEPGKALDYATLLIARPGEKTEEYDGVTLMFHKDAPKGKNLLINMDGLRLLLDYLNQQSKTRLVFILAPDDKEMQSPYDPEADMLVVQVHASIPPAQLTGSLVAAILKRADISLDEATATAKAYAIYSAMRCVSPEGYQGMLLPNGTARIEDQVYQEMLPALCGIEALVVYIDAIAPPSTPKPVVPDASNNGA